VIQLSKQRVLVTGGAGFIGSEVVRQLAVRGFDVLIVDNLVNGKRENLEGVLAKNVDLVVSDIRDRKSMTSLFRDVDIVFHLACLGVRHSLHSPMENQEVNATATLGLLEIAMTQKVKRFVCISTSEVYGMVHTTPIAEDHPTRRPVQFMGPPNLREKPTHVPSGIPLATQPSSCVPSMPMDPAAIMKAIAEK